MKILLVEDTKGEQLLVKVMVKRKAPGADLTICSDGQEAIEHLEANPESLPDFILLDLNMPRMGGHEFLETYFPDKGTTSPSVIVLTSSLNAEDEAKVLEYSAVKRYQRKPLNEPTFSELLEFIESSDS